MSTSWYLVSTLLNSVSRVVQYLPKSLSDCRHWVTPMKPVPLGSRKQTPDASGTSFHPSGRSTRKPLASSYHFQWSGSWNARGGWARPDGGACALDGGAIAWHATGTAAGVELAPPPGPPPLSPPNNALRPKPPAVRTARAVPTMTQRV